MKDIKFKDKIAQGINEVTKAAYRASACAAKKSLIS